MSLIHRNQELISALRPLIDGERILVTGASGWLGKNLIDLFLDIKDGNLSKSFLFTGSSQKQISLFENRKAEISTWNYAEIEEFSPTVFINLAFLTRDKLLSTPIDEYISINHSLIEKAKWVSSLNSIKYILTTSSGVAVKKQNYTELKSKPYETLKFIEEQSLFHEAIELSKKLLILKIWTMSGKYIKHGDLLVIQSIITSMLNNLDFKIESKQDVWRTYIDAYEMIGLALLALLTGREGIINSGGELVSLNNLAETARNLFSSNSKIINSRSKNDLASFYTSQKPDLNQVAKKFNIKTLSISEQIRETAKTIVEK